MAEWLDSSALGIAQLAHAMDESIHYHKGGDAACSQITLSTL